MIEIDDDAVFAIAAKGMAVDLYSLYYAPAPRQLLNMTIEQWADDSFRPVQMRWIDRTLPDDADDVRQDIREAEQYRLIRAKPFQKAVEAFFEHGRFDSNELSNAISADD